MREQEHQRGKSLHHHDKHAAHKAGHRPDDPHGVTGPTNEEPLMMEMMEHLTASGFNMLDFNVLDEAMDE